ncbi:hypothetical protein MGYG_05563 [Nannizzia gypsea CBS 118893]|uniref:Uncharacterized protein n=1 Tax=Arthroderma gypseum (strain ATCC MYA-4604 / CBS 118893) TaxID=535722 RepID=E4UWM4_ARTGP|nr:hypothetical protein MGYG_05563 [Nannizzia gypsea CBS 118893]EFR02567.1 hypothetical protein MGYG_05563 [Nannizzia gypsea CBS 118893]
MSDSTSYQPRDHQISPITDRIYLINRVWASFGCCAWASVTLAEAFGYGKLRRSPGVHHGPFPTRVIRDRKEEEEGGFKGGHQGIHIGGRDVRSGLGMESIIYAVGYHENW